MRGPQTELQSQEDFPFFDMTSLSSMDQIRHDTQAPRPHVHTHTLKQVYPAVFHLAGPATGALMNLPQVSFVTLSLLLVNQTLITIIPLTSLVSSITNAHTHTHFSSPNRLMDGELAEADQLGVNGAELQLCLRCDCIVALTTIHVRIAGMPGCGKSNRCSPSVSWCVYFSQSILSLFYSFSFFCFPLFTFPLLSFFFAILYPFHYPTPDAELPAYWATSCLNHSSNVLDMPLFFSSYHMTCSFPVTVHPLPRSFSLSLPTSSSRRVIHLLPDI